MDVDEIRSRLGLTQRQLADLLVVTQPAVAAWEAGRRTPTGEVAIVLGRVARCFDGPNRRYGDHRGRPIELPEERWEPVVRPDREVTLPDRLDWSPRAGQRDLRDRDQRAGTYAQVLDEGTPADVRFWIDPDELVALWPDVPVARHLREPVGQLVAALRR
ncbi:MAG TPA: helix-turn-helix transcriptional regulator [Acidimicrobiales bacterium]|nr:helix-turn-helix transcriptional regulator [Acidimicrobiales bacterium]